MRAVTLDFASDDLSGLTVGQTEMPEPAPGMLRVRVSKAAVHPSDLNYIRGEYRAGIERLIWNYKEEEPAFDSARQQLHPQLPCIPGGEGVGVVDSCGEGVDSSAWLGKRVGLFAGPPNGSWQESVALAPHQLFPVPEGLADEQAALMMLNPLTALVMTRQVLKVEAQQWVLVSAGASAVSKFVAALGHHYGFKTISLVRNDSYLDSPPEQIADVVINTAKDDVRERVKEATDGQGVQFALDCVGGETGQQLMSCLGEGGKMLLYGTLAGPSMTLHSRDLMMPNAFVGGFYLPGWLRLQAPATLGEVMGELGILSAKGLFHTPIHAQFPLENALEAVRASLEPGRTGKVLLDIGN